jgi:hypothetical protein
MKNLIVIIALATLAGCSVDNSEALHDETQKQVGAYGVTLMPSQGIYATFPDMVKYYEETMTCMGMTADGPTIQYVSYSEYFNGAYGAPWGGYISEGLVFVNNDHLGLGFDRDARIDMEILKHEYIHHILDMNGADHSHNNPLFVECGLGVNTYN